MSMGTPKDKATSAAGCETGRSGEPLLPRERSSVQQAQEEVRHRQARGPLLLLDHLDPWPQTLVTAMAPQPAQFGPRVGDRRPTGASRGQTHKVSLREPRVPHAPTLFQLEVVGDQDGNPRILILILI